MPARPAAFPANEAERVATLHRLEILDTLPERAYDDLTLLASQICGTPIALVALIDTHRQWYKSVVGTTLKETSRNEAFCAHAILKPDDVLVIEDAADDPRFVDNAFVTGEPHIRFYAGAPIVMASGEAIGAMCVIDTKPRAMTAALGECLRALARQAALLLDLREKAIVSERIALESEKTTVEARLKQKRGLELLELVLRGGQMGLWDLDIVTGRWTVNAREQMMLGYAAVDSADADTDWRSLIHPDDWPMLNAAMEPHLNGRASFYECTHRMRHADGHYLWVLDRGVIVERNVRGEATRLVGTHVDVTESRRREEEQRRGAERLELALSSGEQGLWDWDIVGGEVVRTEKWARLFGYTAGEMEREARTGAFRSRQLVHPDDLDAWRTARDRHLSGLTPTFEIEVRMRRRDGRIIWVLERGKVVERDALGRALRAVGTTTDITDRKNNELALRRASELLISIGAMARVGGWSIDIESSAVFWTDEIYRIHDLNPAERPTLAQAIGFFTPGCRPVLEAAIDAAIAHGTRWDLELSLISARGRLVWIRTLGKVESKDGKAARLVGTAQDITDRRQAETLLVENERQLRLITDSLPALVAHVDTDQRYTFVNNSVESVFGVTRESVIGKTMHELRDDATYATMAPAHRARPRR